MHTVWCTPNTNHTTTVCKLGTAQMTVWRGSGEKRKFSPIPSSHGSPLVTPARSPPTACPLTAARVPGAGSSLCVRETAQHVVFSSKRYLAAVSPKSPLSRGKRRHSRQHTFPSGHHGKARLHSTTTTRVIPASPSPNRVEGLCACGRCQTGGVWSRGCLAHFGTACDKATPLWPRQSHWGWETIHTSHIRPTPPTEEVWLRGPVLLPTPSLSARGCRSLAPTAASGTLSSLCRVLFTFRSRYFIRYRLMPMYLALAGVHLPVRTAFPSCSTLG